jgi:hypothetical protein
MMFTASPRLLALIPVVVALATPVFLVSDHTGRTMQEGMQQMPSPGPEHKWIKGRVGTWEVKNKMRMTPGAPMMESAATEVCELICGGFWVSCIYKADFSGRAFEGRQLMGYDQQKKKFISTWIDSWSSHLMVMEGTLNKDKTILTSSGSSFDPQQGKTVKIRSEVHFKSEDQTIFKMFSPGPDGKEFMNMEATYTRKK